MKLYIAALPEVVRVGPFDIRIEKWGRNAAMANRAFGEFSINEQIIRIDSEMVTPIKAVDTLLHEISHAIYWAYGIDDENKQERIVLIYAKAWTQIYRDNSWLLHWIKVTLHEIPAAVSS